MPIITVSRGSYMGGVRVAECAAEKLGYRCLSREELVEVTSSRYGVRADKLAEALDEVPGIWDRWSTARGHYLICLRSALIREVSNGNVVYHGHAGHLLLQGVPNLLKVRIIANMDFRVDSVMEQQNVCREDACTYIKREDEKRAKWTKFLYNMDWSDPTCYDMVINISTLDIQDACSMVVTTAKLDKFKATPETEKVFADLLLATEVRAILATNECLIDCGVSVAAANGIVTLGGIMDTREVAEKIVDRVKGVQGVSKINSEMRVRKVF